MMRPCFVLVLCAAACCAQDALPWWKTANIYQIYPRSFKDSDGNGVGDLKGITQMADYFKEIGVDAVWLSPIFTSPMADFGYDVSDFTGIEPLFGTMDDFDALSKKFKQLGIRLLLDFVPNHSSDEHPWFKQSVNKVPDYDDFYIWKDPKGYVDGNPVPPNNWMSMFGGSDWQWREERRQFYLHQFNVKQPDLNYRNPRVVGNMTAVIKFWMDRGVDGLRVDAVKYIFEDARFPDAPAVLNTPGNTFGTQQHMYQEDQQETYALSNYWGNFTNQMSLRDGLERALFMEVYAANDVVMRYYSDDNGKRVIPFNFNLILFLSEASRPIVFKQTIDSWMQAMPAGQVPNWVLGNHDNQRVADKYGTEMVDVLNMLTCVLPGVKFTYYGEEYGMRDTFVRPDQVVDNNGVQFGNGFTRDPARTPMQWDDSTSAGFSRNATPWLPVNPNYWWLNVDAQWKAETSHLKVFQAMNRARKDPVLQRGDLNVLVPDDDTLLVVRQYNGAYFVLITNMGSRVLTYTSQSLFKPTNLDLNMTVVVGSINSGHTPGTNVKQGCISLTLRPKAAVLLKTTSSAISAAIPCLFLLAAVVLVALKR